MSALRRRTNINTINPNAAHKTASQEQEFNDKIQRIEATIKQLAQERSEGRLASVAPSVQILPETANGTATLVVSNFPLVNLTDLSRALPSDVVIGLGREWTITVPSPVVRHYKTTDWLLILLALAVVCLVVIVKITGYWEPRL